MEMFLNTHHITYRLNWLHFRKQYSTLKLLICITFSFQGQLKSMVFRFIIDLRGTKESEDTLFVTTSRFMLTISESKIFSKALLCKVQYSLCIISTAFLNIPTKIVRTFYQTSFSYFLIVKTALELPR